MPPGLAVTSDAGITGGLAAYIRPVPVLLVGQVEQPRIDRQVVRYPYKTVQVQQAIAGGGELICGAVVDAALAVHQCPYQFTAEASIGRLITQAQYAFQWINAVQRLAGLLVLASGIGQAAAQAGADRQSEAVEEQLAAQFSPANGDPVEVLILEGQAVVAGGVVGQGDLFDEVLVAVVEQRQAETAVVVLTAQADFKAVAGFRLQVGIAARYCDQLLLLGDGGVRASGTPQQVLQPAPLHRVFGVDVLVQQHPERGHPLIISR